MSKAKAPTPKTVDANTPKEFDHLVKLYQSLTPREKLLIDTFDTLCCLETKDNFQSPLDTRLRDAVKWNIADVPTDHETQWIVSVNQLAYAGLK